MDAPPNSLANLHFALIYIDDHGKLRFESSSSVADDCQNILSPTVADSFLRAVAGTVSLESDSPPSPTQSCRSSFSQRTNDRKRQRPSYDYMVPPIAYFQETILPIRNENLLRRYYEQAFASLQQTNCRILAKAYIRHVEPRKQVNYPYNGHKTIAGVPRQFDPEETKPAWWPAGVVHREPDHLRKPDRIRLLVHILCELRESHGMSVERLRDADDPIRRQISPKKHLQILNEIYRVREEEERYLAGDPEVQEVVCVSQVNIPGPVDLTHLTPVARPYLESEIAQQDDNRLESQNTTLPSSDPASDTPNFRSTAEGTHLATAAAIPSGSVTPTIPSTWTYEPNIQMPTSLPSLSTAINLHGAASTTPTNLYTHQYSAPSMLLHHQPTTLEIQPFSTVAFTNPPLHPAQSQSQSQSHPQQIGPRSILHRHHHAQPLVPTSLPPPTSFDGCPQPYYFGY
ncbi:hypothetical protein BJY04DRAFT_107296 [Aspergillus karnatakaensis]|uniref:DUF2841 domain-containing protein n=1 Tax=Aspergillus karnatakaensis TaxID=1810916 RepID=UPI003CCDA562